MKLLLKMHVMVWGAGLAALFGLSSATEAASMWAVVNKTSVTVGQSITLSVYVDAGGVAINNAEADVRYPSELFDASAVSSNSSIFTMWTEPPQILEGSGTVHFNGGIPNPGYNGSRGRVVSFTLTAKQPGSGSISFSGAAVRANDGEGTNVLTGTNSVDLTVQGTEPAVNPEQPTVETPTQNTSNQTSGVGAAPVITSPTNPDQTKWYTSGDTILNWSIPSSATKQQDILSKADDAVPNIAVPISQTSKSLTDISDGIWYFNVRYMAGGEWSKVGSYMIKIDSTAPTGLSATTDTDGAGRTTLQVNATDALSGIRGYEITIDNSASIKITAEDAVKPFTLPLHSIGSHTLVMTVYDVAGNESHTTKSFIVSPTVAPVIDTYSHVIDSGDALIASGHVPYPHATVLVTVQTANGFVASYRVKTNAEGMFNFTSENVDGEGSYLLWAQVVSDTVNGPATEPLTVHVLAPSWLHRALYSHIVPNWLFILLLLVLAVLAAMGWYKYFALRLRYARLERLYHDHPGPGKSARTVQAVHESNVDKIK